MVKLQTVKTNLILEFNKRYYTLTLYKPRSARIVMENTGSIYQEIQTLTPREDRDFVHWNAFPELKQADVSGSKR